MQWLTDTDGSQKILSCTPDHVHHKHGVSFTTPVFPNSSATSKVEASMYLSNKSGDVSNKVTFYFCPDVEDKPPELEATRQVVTTKRSSAALKATAQETGQDQVVEEKSAGSIAVPPQRVRQSEESSNNLPTGSAMCEIVNNFLDWKTIYRIQLCGFHITNGSYWSISHRIIGP